MNMFAFALVLLLCSLCVVQSGEPDRSQRDEPAFSLRAKTWLTLIQLILEEKCGDDGANIKVTDKQWLKLSNIAVQMGREYQSQLIDPEESRAMPKRFGADHGFGYYGKK